MLGPASFVNHACTPNARFICGGETRGKTIVRIETLRHINADEEIFVKYSEDYFGPNNIDCRCSACLEKLFAPPLHEVGSSSKSHMPSSESRSPQLMKEATTFGQDPLLFSKHQMSLMADNMRMRHAAAPHRTRHILKCLMNLMVSLEAIPFHTPPKLKGHSPRPADQRK